MKLVHARPDRKAAEAVATAAAVAAVVVAVDMVVVAAVAAVTAEVIADRANAIGYFLGARSHQRALFVRDNSFS
jgi:hypothetical protein